MFLMPTPPRVTKRSRLDNFLLLFLRCLAVVLLAAAFARPLMTGARDEAAAGEGARTCLVHGYQREHAPGWRMGCGAGEGKCAGGRLPACGSGGDRELSNRAPRALVGFEQWSATVPGERAERVRAALSTVQPGWHATALDAALLYAVDLLDRPAEGFRKGGEIVVVTDLQEGSRLTELQGFEWPKEIRVRVETVGGTPGENVSVAWVGDQSGSATTVFFAPAAGDEPLSGNVPVSIHAGMEWRRLLGRVCSSGTKPRLQNPQSLRERRGHSSDR